MKNIQHEKQQKKDCKSDMNRNFLKTIDVPVADCIPMPETKRNFINERDEERLAKIIARDGFKKQYAPRVIYEKQLGQYLVFDGSRRLETAKKLGLETIPVIDETETLTKTQAIAEGIKANNSHGYYNALDRAFSLKELSNSFAKTRKTVGRPETVNLTKLSDLTGYSEQTVGRYLQLLNLPKEVQNLVGKGKLGMTNALVMMKLLGTPFENMISTLAQEAVSKGISRNDLQKRVAMIQKKGYYDEEKRLCVGCQKPYSKDRLSFPCLCPECAGKVRSGQFEDPKQRRTLAMLRFLNLRNWVEKKNQSGYKVPDWFFDRLQDLEAEWRGN